MESTIEQLKFDGRWKDKSDSALSVLQVNEHLDGSIHTSTL